MMVGSELPSPETRERTVQQKVLLEVVGLTIESGALAPLEGPAAAFSVSEVALETDEAPPERDVVSHRPLDDVSFAVHAGEIVGVAGVEGNGQTELVEAIMGLRSATGIVLLEDQPLGSVSTLERRRLGLGYIPEDRQRDGMVLSFPLWENVLLGHQAGPPFVNAGFVDRKQVRRRTSDIVAGFDVRTPGIEVAAFTLSGGNQQKLIVGREMMSDPLVLIASHPTRGVDVGAQAVIWDILRDARAKGLGTLLISADLEELIGLSDRLLVMLRGRVVAELDPAQVTPADLGSYMTGAATEERRERGCTVNRRIVGGILAPLIAAAVAIIVSSIALLIANENPITAFQEMWSSIDSIEALVSIINRAVPYYVAGVAVAVGFKMNLFNIGAAGQYQLAALLAAGAAAAVTLPAPIHVAFVFLVAIVVGGAYAAIAGVLKVWRGVNEVISTIMLNYIAIGISAFLLAEPLRNESSGNLAQTRALPRVGPAAQSQRAVRRHRPGLAGGRHPARLPSVRHPPRHRLLADAQPQSLRLQPAGLRRQRRRRQDVRRQPEADGADHDHPLRCDRRDDRPRSADDRGVQLRRPVPEDARVHGPRAGAARPQPPSGHRRRSTRVGDHRAGDAAAVHDRHPAGDRCDPAGVVPPRGRHRLRGRQAVDGGRGGQGHRRAHPGRPDATNGRGHDMSAMTVPLTVSAPTAPSGRRLSRQQWMAFAVLAARWSSRRRGSSATTTT